ncbi:MAG: hypothetical protein HOK61_10730 [Alphaproteobacteria bacterium]|jgi:hypothetical protein|nr:hypothetical protein [Alphaproteobacteria bacterium]
MSDVTFDKPLGDSRADRLLDNLDPDIRESFTDQQRRALAEAMRTSTWQRQPIDIRVSLPFLSSRWFLTVVSGRDVRHDGRRRAERLFRPLSTIGNTLFMGAISTVVCSVILVAVLVYSSIIAG